MLSFMSCSTTASSWVSIGDAIGQSDAGVSVANSLLVIVSEREYKPHFGQQARLLYRFPAPAAVIYSCVLLKISKGSTVVHVAQTMVALDLSK